MGAAGRAPRACLVPGQPGLAPQAWSGRAPPAARTAPALSGAGAPPGCGTAGLCTAPRTPEPALRGGGSEPGRAEPGQSAERRRPELPGDGSGTRRPQAAPLRGGPVLGGERMEREIKGG